MRSSAFSQALLAGGRELKIGRLAVMRLSRNRNVKNSTLRAAPAMSLLSIALLMTPINGCQTVVFKSRCPPLKAYPADFQKQAAKELQKAGAAVQEMVTDYGQHRDACRAIEKKD
jgi:hypothetical protein